MPLTISTRPFLVGLACIVFVAPSCRCSVDNGAAPMAASGPEDWIVGGKPYHVDRTYYLRRSWGEVAYMIDYSVPDSSVLFGMNDDAALEVAMPLMKYALETHRYERSQFRTLRGQSPASVAIGVNLTPNERAGVPPYQIVQSIGEIVLRSKKRSDAD